MMDEEQAVAFNDLGIRSDVCDALRESGILKPTYVQVGMFGWIANCALSYELWL